MKRPSKAKAEASLALDSRANGKTSTSTKPKTVHAYGIRTELNARRVLDKKEQAAVFQALKNETADYYIPDFSTAKPLQPLRSNMFEVKALRCDFTNGKLYDDMNEKWLYIKQQDGRLRVGKELSATQPVITHEFLEDALYDLAEKHKDEFEIIPNLTADDRKGYRRFFGVLSKKLNTEIKNSFRKDDVVRVGAYVHNGIGEDTAVGFDAFTYALRCENGLIGRGKDLGSASWAHQGSVEKLQDKILAGLEDMFEAGQEYIQFIKKSNEIKMLNEHIQQIYNNTNISDKYFDPQYFAIDRNKKEDDPKRIQLANNKATLWEGINAITQNVWHSDEIAFGRKSRQLRKLNNVMVAIAKR